MKPYTFFIKTNAPAKAILLAKQEVQSRGGIMQGGKFNAKGFSGEYKQVHGGVEITLTEKPMMIPIILIEPRVREWFNSMGA